MWDNDNVVPRPFFVTDKMTVCQIVPSGRFIVRVLRMLTYYFYRSEHVRVGHTIRIGHFVFNRLVHIE